jgi:hypothetical protein
MSNLTEKINNNNIHIVRSQIERKKTYKPFFGTQNAVGSIITDMDHYPYTRFYRGVYNSTEPAVMEREAGWRKVVDNCYIDQSSCTQSINYPSHCFQTACSTVYPCYANTVKDYDAHVLLINKNCIVEYR